MQYSTEDKRKIVKDDYDAIAEIYATSYSEIDYYKSYVNKFAKSLSGQVVLDIGCGPGQFTNYLCELGLKAIGVDFSNRLLDIARKNYPNVEFINADICKLETSNKVDGIFTKDVLFHLPDEDILKVLQMFKKILKPNGKICIIMDMPKEAGEQIFVEELDENYKIYYNYLTPEKLQGLLKQAEIIVNDIQIVKENEFAASYASGLMVFQASVM